MRGKALLAGGTTGGEGDTRVSWESARLAESRISGVPSSRQKLSVSSSKERLQVGQRFTDFLFRNVQVTHVYEQGYFSPPIMAPNPHSKRINTQKIR